MAPDIAVAETLSWVDLSNRIVAEAELSVLATTVEPQARAELVMDAISERWAIFARFAAFAQYTVVEARRVLHQLDSDASRRRTEIDALAQRMEAKEQSLLSELHARYDVKVSEFEEGGAKLHEKRSKLQAEVVDLSRRRDEELSALASFRSESDERRKRLQEQKVLAANEMQELEQQLETLRAKVNAEKTLLASLSEEEMVKRKKLDVLAEMGSSSNARGGPTAPSASLRSPSTPSASDIVRGSTSRLDFGISTLQNVRDQLRDIRESSLSPIRRSGSPSATPPTAQPRDVGGDVDGTPQAATDVSASGMGYNYLASTASPTVNPWKERLRQLQGDLQSLRADLGAK